MRFYSSVEVKKLFIYGIIRCLFVLMLLFSTTLNLSRKAASPNPISVYTLYAIHCLMNRV